MATVTRTLLEPTAAGKARVDVTLVVVDYRNPELLGRCLARVFAADPVPADVVVVDVDPLEEFVLPDSVAGSSDGPRLRVATTSDNPGYSAACNRGAEGAATEWILFMNSDVMLEPDTLGAVARRGGRRTRTWASPPVGWTCPTAASITPAIAASPAPSTRSGTRPGSTGLFPRSQRFGHYRMTWLDTSTVHDVEACSGAFLLIRREALEAVGGWDERYWFYAEDLDLCLRVTQAGWRVRYVGTAAATHEKSSSSHVRRPDGELDPEQLETRRRVKRAIVDSHERFYREHLEADTARPLRPLVQAMFALQRRSAGRA